MKFRHRQLHQLTDAQANFEQAEPLLTSAATQIAALQVAVNTLTTSTAARAHRAAAFTLGTGGWQKIPVDTSDFDPGSRLTLASNRYVCPLAGYYQANGQVAATGSIYAAIYRNGVLAAQGTQAFTAVVSDIVSCAATDYLELYTYNVTGGITLTTGAAFNYLSIAKVG